jgi:hypothetical protein
VQWNEPGKGREPSGERRGTGEGSCQALGKGREGKDFGPDRNEPEGELDEASSRAMEAGLPSGRRVEVAGGRCGANRRSGTRICLLSGRQGRGKGAGETGFPGASDRG